MPESATTNDYSMRASCTAGLLMRGQVRRVIRESALRLNLELDLQEEKGWIESWFGVRLSGAEADVDRFTEWWNNLLEENDA